MDVQAFLSKIAERADTPAALRFVESCERDCYHYRRVLRAEKRVWPKLFSAISEHITIYLYCQGAHLAKLLGIVKTHIRQFRTQPTHSVV